MKTLSHAFIRLENILLEGMPDLLDIRIEPGIHTAMQDDGDLRYTGTEDKLMTAIMGIQEVFLLAFATLC